MKIIHEKCRRQEEGSLNVRIAYFEASAQYFVRKSAHRLKRNFYRGLQGDAVNTMPAAAFNFKRAMRLLV